MLQTFVMFVGLVAASESPRAKTEPVALEVARKWLLGVASGELALVKQGTSMPFTYATTAKVKRCERKVANQRALPEWLKCLRTSDKLLVKEAQHGSLMLSDPPNVGSKALQALSAKISPSGNWIEAFINGDGVIYTFRFLLVDGLVGAFLVEAEFEKG